MILWEKTHLAAALQHFQNYTDWPRGCESTARIRPVVSRFKQVFSHGNFPLVKPIFIVMTQQWQEGSSFSVHVGYVSLCCCDWNRSIFFQLFHQEKSGFTSQFIPLTQKTTHNQFHVIAIYSPHSSKENKIEINKIITNYTTNNIIKNLKFRLLFLSFWPHLFLNFQRW